MYYVYFLTNKHNNVLYIGMTNNLLRRLQEHRENINWGFTAKYKAKKLVYFETHYLPMDAIKQEKRYKCWHKQWKWNLIRANNPKLEDLTHWLVYSSLSP